MTTTSERNPPAPRHASADPEARPGGAEDLGGGNLDKVRDILFGGQMRDNERRFARLEERLSRDTADMKEDVRKRLAAIEEFVKRETEALADRIKAEHEERSDATKELLAEVRDGSRALEKKIGQIDEHLARAQRELRQQILDLHQRLTDEIQQKVDELLARLGREIGELRADKADRAAIATLLTEMAMRLTNELSIPDVEE